MRKVGFYFIMILGLSALWVSNTTLIYSAGFAFFEQGTKAMGMAGAFTAQADDPSAMFHNIAGIAFLDKREFSVGATMLNIPDSTYQGISLFPPGPNVTGRQVNQVYFPAHLYVVQPITDKVKFGLGVNSPFGLTTKWKDRDAWAGRFLSIKANLVTLDLNPGLGWQVTPKFAVGAGAIFRFSRVELVRHVRFPIPFRGLTEIANVRLKSDWENGYGFNVGLLHKVSDRFSWGLSYRGQMGINYSGNARFAQISTGSGQLDSFIAGVLPFNQGLPITTTIKFPDQGSLGVAFGLTSNLLIENDLNWTGWHKFKAVDINFTGRPLLSSTLRQDWRDVLNDRVGLRWTRSQTSEWRLGYFFDKSPQPEASVSPLLPDADRNGFSVGYGYKGGWLKPDFSFMYVRFNSRTTRNNRDGFNGVYNGDVVLFGVTLNW